MMKKSEVKSVGIAKLVASLNYREANLVPVTWYNREIAAYTPRVKAAVDAVRRSQLAEKLLEADRVALDSDGWCYDRRVLSVGLLTAVKAEFLALGWRVDYLVDVVKADLGRKVGEALEIELGLVNDYPDMGNDYGSCPACAGSGMGGRMIGDERTGEIRCSCCGHFAAE